MKTKVSRPAHIPQLGKNARPGQAPRKYIFNGSFKRNPNVHGAALHFIPDGKGLVFFSFFRFFLFFLKKLFY